MIINLSNPGSKHPIQGLYGSRGIFLIPSPNLLISGPHGGHHGTSNFCYSPHI